MSKWENDFSISLALSEVSLSSQHPRSAHISRCSNTSQFLLGSLWVGLQFLNCISWYWNQPKSKFCKILQKFGSVQTVCILSSQFFATMKISNSTWSQFLLSLKSAFLHCPACLANDHHHHQWLLKMCTFRLTLPLLMMIPWHMSRRAMMFPLRLRLGWGKTAKWCEILS